MRSLIKPDTLIERDAIEHQGIPVPTGRVMAVPRGIRIFGMPAVDIRLMKAGALVVVDDHQVVIALDHLEKRTKTQDGSWQTARLGIVFAVTFATQAGYGLGFRQKLGAAAIGI